MKKITTILIFCIILLFLSSCSSPIKVNKKLKGEGEYWTIYYNIKGHVDAKVSEEGVYYYVSDGNYSMQIQYNGNLDDLQLIRQFEVQKIGQSGLSIHSDGPLTMYPLLNERGTASAQTLVYFYYNDEISMTIKWDGGISGEETIILNSGK